jgi:hypothetical protein
MPRSAAATDFTVDVEGIGSFRFARRRMTDELQINAEYSRLTDGVAAPTPYLASLASMISELAVLTVKAPDGWDVMDLDPLDDATFGRIAKVSLAFREKENSFRPRPEAKSEGSSEGASQ